MRSSAISGYPGGGIASRLGDVGKRGWAAASGPAGTLARTARTARTALPGLALTAGAVVIAWSASRMWPALSPLTAAVVLGVLAANLLPATVMSSARPGLQVAAKSLMRLGIVLLGLQLALGDVLRLGWQTLALVVAVVFATFFGTQWLGRRMGLPGRQPLLIATGFAICGASAVAAMEGVTRRPGDSEDDPDPVIAVALVTLCGSLAILVLPLLRGPLGLHDPMLFGHWVGASVHDVGQVVAAASAGGAAAVNGAVVVKLMRVAMLAPMVAGTAVAGRRRIAGRRRMAADSAARTASASGSALPAPRSLALAAVGARDGARAAAVETQPRLSTAAGGAGAGGDARAVSVAGSRAAAEPSTPAPKHPPIVPLFVLGFLAMIALRTTGVLPASALTTGKQLQDLLLAVGMFGLGTGVRLRELARTGAKPLLLGLASWALIASAAYVGVRLSS